MAKPRLVELTNNRFLYRCDDCGKEWETMTKGQANKKSPPSHSCRNAAKPHEDFSQAAARIVREGTK